ncbi:SMP-30/gluconolactonase/LRE family protein [Paracoccus onubensis]|uniref:SMP-30/gluconolactonase/LRE family protein n=1 Tax=Paracoccus onubensis TaxID=1675788 RepID=A0A418SUJ4_9RHOB|nr:SMP-30/gluconolactonase/LRE family protein [Paracoccus onubensis]RJE84602.1 SMP-30/gluconolactonase/LRE family protein [Paracoccus onubensis]
MKLTPEIRVLHRGPDMVGEGPIWHPERRELLWVDILARMLHRMPLEGGEPRSVTFDIPPAALALDTTGKVIVAAGTGWYRLEDDGRLTALAAPSGSGEGWRMNDGCTDRDGRFWTGRIEEPRGSGVEGCLYRLDAAGAAPVLGGLRTQNGLAVSLDGTTLYLSDSHPEVNAIWAFDLDRATGALSNQRVFHKPRAGRADGAAIDAEDCYWFAEIDAGRLVRLAPDGRVIATVELPVSRPTKLAFAGPDLRTICVTSMSILPEDRDPAREPLAGALLAFEVETAGALPTPVSVLPGQD